VALFVVVIPGADSWHGGGHPLFAGNGTWLTMSPTIPQGRPVLLARAMPSSGTFLRCLRRDTALTYRTGFSVIS
jgi:hypothetical protein